MKYVKCIAVLLIGIFLLSSVIPQATAAAQTSKMPLFDKILMAFFKATVGLRGIVPWAVFRLAEPDVFVAEPNVIDIEYLNQTEIYIGVKNETTGNFESLDYQEVPELFEGIDYTFELEIPDYFPEGALIARFDPQMLEIGEKGEFKTKLTITSNIPEDMPLPKNIVLRVNITKWTTAGNLYLPPKGKRGIFPFYMITGKWGTFMWLFMSINPANPFGKLYSGKRTTTPEECVHVDIIVKVNRYHLAEIIPPQHMEIEPNQLLSIPIQIQNLGSHLDTFNFNVSTSTGSQLRVTRPPAITLAPNEVGHTTISVASPLNFQDPGTTHSIFIEAYSIYEPEKVFANTVILTTRGVYVSEMNAVYSAFIGILILLVVGLFLYRRRRVFNKICKKPDKPWEIPGEKEYLEKLKEKDKEEYDNVLRMMEDEYRSATLWHKSYCKSILSKAREKKNIGKSVKISINRFASIFKRPREKKLEKPVEPKEEPKEEKLVEPVEVKKEEKRVLVDRIAEIEKRRKEQIILKIKRAQEKQRRKLRSST